MIIILAMIFFAFNYPLEEYQLYVATASSSEGTYTLIPVQHTLKK